MPSALDPEAVRRLEAAGQGHRVAHARSLDPEAASTFLAAAAAHPWVEIGAAFARPAVPVPPVLRPPHALTLRRQRSEGGLVRRLAETGRGLLRGGRVATLLLAGGQGTRLGHDGPKGDFVLGPEPDRTLYAIQAERVSAAGRSVGRAVPFFVLVSEGTEEATRAAFARHRAAWGLEPDQVRFVRQRELPALDERGRAVLAGPGALALAPDGHGGALGALIRAGILDELAEAEVDVLTTWQVDNPLALPLDPVMLGWMVERRAHTVGKAVRRLADERVGVWTRDLEGRHRVVEYSEFPEGGMPEELTLGSIAVHAFSVAWLKELFDGGWSLPFHRAHKKVPCLDDEGRVVDPEAPNAHKLELFLFDVVPEAERAEVHEVAREREFAPVKNARGVDSPETARALVEDEVRRWYGERGRPPPEPVSLHPLDMV